MAGRHGSRVAAARRKEALGGSFVSCTHRPLSAILPPMLPGATREPPSAASAASKALRAQALAALRALLDGVHAADRAARGRLLRGHEDRIHAGLVSVILRMVFVLFAEARGLLPRAASCSLGSLHEELRRDEAREGGAIDSRYGAWARVVALFGLLREGSLFDPDRCLFLEGGRLPRIADGAVLRVLDRLLVIDGAPAAYGQLDVEHVGAVYEALMGFEGALPVQPTEERRRLGAHYTSRAMTEIVVERTLGPLLRDGMSPDEILALRICDPAMGAGAFLVEACRKLARHLVRAWERTGALPAHEEPLR